MPAVTFKHYIINIAPGDIYRLTPMLFVLYNYIAGQKDDMFLIRCTITNTVISSSV